MKRILAIILALLMCATIIPASVFAGGDVTFEATYPGGMGNWVFLPKGEEMLINLQIWHWDGDECPDENKINIDEDLSVFYIHDGGSESDALILSKVEGRPGLYSLKYAPGADTSKSYYLAYLGKLESTLTSGNTMTIDCADSRGTGSSETPVTTGTSEEYTFESTYDGGCGNMMNLSWNTSQDIQLQIWHWVGDDVPEGGKVPMSEGASALRITDSNGNETGKLTVTLVSAGLGLYNVTCSKDAKPGEKYYINYTGSEMSKLSTRSICIIIAATENYIAENKETPANPFSDVKSTDYYYDAAQWAYNNGVTAGVGGGKFGPSATCTRGQIVTFLWNQAGQPEPKSTNNPFTDVKTTDWFYKAVLWAVENKVTSGTSATTFSPAGKCKYEQIITFMWNAQGQPKATGTSPATANLKDNVWYKQPMAWADTTGLLAKSASFKVGSDCPRCDIVQYIYYGTPEAERHLLGGGKPQNMDDDGSYPLSAYNPTAFGLPADIDWIADPKTDADYENNILCSFLTGKYELGFEFNTKAEAQLFASSAEHRIDTMANISPLMSVFCNGIHDMTYTITEKNGKYVFNLGIKDCPMTFAEIYEHQKAAVEAAKALTVKARKDGVITDDMTDMEKINAYWYYFKNQGVANGHGGETTWADCMLYDSPYSFLVAKCSDCPGNAAAFNLVMLQEGIYAQNMTGLWERRSGWGHVISRLVVDGVEYFSEFWNGLKPSQLGSAVLHFDFDDDVLEYARAHSIRWGSDTYTTLY